MFSTIRALLISACLKLRLYSFARIGTKLKIVRMLLTTMRTFHIFIFTINSATNSILSVNTIQY